MPIPPLKCCGFVCQKKADKARKDGPAFLTLERLGCCSKLGNCFVCCECCQDEMRVHHGDVGGVQRVDGKIVGDMVMAGDLPHESVIMMDKVPIGGGACTPTIELFERRAPGEISEETHNAVFGEPFAYVEGPTCFGGCLDFCCDFPFFISSKPGKSGDYGQINKLKPQGCAGWCRACCSTADTYDIHLAEAGKKLEPEKKAMFLANMVHLDYWLFEQDRFPVTCEESGDVTWLNILCCLCYCYGCLIPCVCKCPISKKDGGEGTAEI